MFNVSVDILLYFVPKSNLPRRERLRGVCQDSRLNYLRKQKRLAALPEPEAVT